MVDGIEPGHMARREGGGGWYHLGLIYFHLKKLNQNTHKKEEHETELPLYNLIYRLHNVIVYLYNKLTEFYYNGIILRVLDKTEIA